MTWPILRPPTARRDMAASSQRPSARNAGQVLVFMRENHASQGLPQTCRAAHHGATWRGYLPIYGEIAADSPSDTYLSRGTFQKRGDTPANHRKRPGGILPPGLFLPVQSSPLPLPDMLAPRHAKGRTAATFVSAHQKHRLVPLERTARRMIGSKALCFGQFREKL